MKQPQTSAGVDEELRQALTSQSYAALAVALQSSGFLVPLLASSTGDVPAVATAVSGTRSVVVFSGPDAAHAWGGVSKVRLVDGAELLRLAIHQQVDTVLFDPAGPAPAEIAVSELRGLGDGLSRGADGGLRLVTPLQVRPADPPASLLTAVVAAAQDQGIEAWVFERRSLEGTMLTVGVVGTSDQAGAVAARVAALGGLPTTDVVLVDEQIVSALVQQVPQGKVTGR